MMNQKKTHDPINEPLEGILLVDKPPGVKSFQIIKKIRRCSGVKRVGHSGTLDPFATGLLVCLLGRKYTRLSDKFLNQDKCYTVSICLGQKTNTGDSEGEVIESSDKIPEEKEIDLVIQSFQGTQTQVPPMFSAKKMGGKRLYKLARQGIEVERPPITVKLKIEKLSYQYPYLNLRVFCSKGTYIRQVAEDIGEALGTKAYAKELRRESSGDFKIKDALDGLKLDNETLDLKEYLHILPTE